MDNELILIRFKVIGGTKYTYIKADNREEVDSIILGIVRDYKYSDIEVLECTVNHITSAEVKVFW